VLGLQPAACSLAVNLPAGPGHQDFSRPSRTRQGMTCKGREGAYVQVALGRVPALRLRADPRQGDPDPRYFQYIKGLMNITSPRAAGGVGAPRLHRGCARVA
jgi:hypothetical protein